MRKYDKRGESITCPHCKETFLPNESEEAKRVKAMKALRDLGYTLGEIGAMFGGIHPQTVKNEIAKEEVS